MTPCSLVATRQHTEKINCFYILGKHLATQNEIKSLMSHIFSLAGIPAAMNIKKNIYVAQI